MFNRFLIPGLVRNATGGLNFLQALPLVTRFGPLFRLFEI